MEFANPAIKTAVEAEPGIFLHELLEKVRGVTDADEIYLLMATGCVYVDLAAANRHFDLVKRRLAGEELTYAVPARTMRLWIAHYRLAKEQYGNGYVGLLPKTRKRGNRTRRLPDESRNLLIQFVENDYENLRQKTKIASWAALKRKCDERGVVAPSYVTFCAATRQRPAFEQTSKRLGRRAAYPSVPRIVERLPEKSRRDWKTITSAAREARNALAREFVDPSMGTPHVLREEEVHVIANTVAKGMADFPHTV